MRRLGEKEAFSVSGVFQLKKSVHVWGWGMKVWGEEHVRTHTHTLQTPQAVKRRCVHMHVQTFLIFNNAIKTSLINLNGFIYNIKTKYMGGGGTLKGVKTVKTHYRSGISASITLDNSPWSRPVVKLKIRAGCTTHHFQLIWNGLHSLTHDDTHTAEFH